MASRTLVIKTKMDNTEYTAQIKKLERELDILQRSADETSLAPEFRRSEEEAQDLQAEIEKVTNQLNRLKNKQEELNDNGINLDFSGVGNGIEKSVKKIGRMVLALFSVRTAMSLITKATSIVSENNEELANKIESIKYTLAMALEPVITRIVGWVQTLIQYVGYLAKAWFGVDIFANASAKATEKNAKAVKEASKYLAGFDEMNTVSDSSSSSSSGGASAIEPLPEGEIPEWLKWLGDNKDLLAEVGLIILGIAGYVNLLKLGLEGIQALGIMVLIVGVALTIKSIIDYLNDPSWENFGKIITGIGLTLLGLGLAIGSIPLAIAGAIALILGLIASNWEIIKEKLENAQQFFIDNLDIIGAKFGLFGQGIALAISFVIGFITGLFDGLFKGVKKIIDGIIDIFKGNFVGGIKKIFGGLGTILLAPFTALWKGFKPILNLIIGGLNKLINGVNKLQFDVPDWVPVIGGKKWGFNIQNIPKLALGGIVNNPGHGVNIGGAIAGERGQEAVLPLTNGEVMQQLGEAIGKYITVNLTNNTQLDGRTIARQMNKINQNRAFGSNS